MSSTLLNSTLLATVRPSAGGGGGQLLGICLLLPLVVSISISVSVSVSVSVYFVSALLLFPPPLFVLCATHSLTCAARSPAHPPTQPTQPTQPTHSLLSRPTRNALTHTLQRTQALPSFLSSFPPPTRPPAPSLHSLGSPVSLSSGKAE